jgi:rhomboid protease GluP
MDAQVESAPSPAFNAPVPVAKPLWTYIMIGVIAVVWLLSEVTGGSTNPRHMVEDWGANYGPLVSAGQYWRLVTANFIHWGIVHLALNAYSLYVIGTQVEALYGRRRFLTLYLLTGVSGAWMSYVIRDGLSGGASTAIFGLLGALIVYFYKHRKEMGESSRARLTNLGMTLLVNVAISITPGSNIDFWGHFGGFIGGLILAWFLAPRYAATDPFTHTIAATLPSFKRPELANSQITDVNSLAQQAFTVAAFAVAMLVLTLAVALTRQAAT